MTLEIRSSPLVEFVAAVARVCRGLFSRSSIGEDGQVPTLPSSASDDTFYDSRPIEQRRCRAGSFEWRTVDFTAQTIEYRRMNPVRTRAPETTTKPTVSRHRSEAATNSRTRSRVRNTSSKPISGKRSGTTIPERHGGGGSISPCV